MATFKKKPRDIFDGDALQWMSLKVGFDKNPGDPVKVGRYVGICETYSTRADGTVPNGIKTDNAPGFATVALRGVYYAPATIHTGGATQGAAIFILADNTLTTNAAASGAALFGLLNNDLDQTAGAKPAVEVYLVGVSDK